MEEAPGTSKKYSMKAPGTFKILRKKTSKNGVAQNHPQLISQNIAITSPLQKSKKSSLKIDS